MPVGQPRLPAIAHLPPLYSRAKNELRQNDAPVRALAAKVRRVLGDRLQPEDSPLVRRWCELEFLIGAAFTEVYTRGLLKPDGEPFGLANVYRLMVHEQQLIADRLGMSPKARLDLSAAKTNAAIDLSEIAQPLAESVIEIGRARGQQNGASPGEDDEIIN